MTIMAPKNKWELSDMLKFAVAFDGPIAIRYPRGQAYEGLYENRAAVEYGKSEWIYKEKDIAIFAIGSMVKTAVDVHKQLKDEGYNCSLNNGRFVKPIDEEALKEAAETHSLIVTMEENVASGGFGEKVREYLDSIKADCKVLAIAIPDKFVEHGSVDQLYKEIGMDADSVVARIKECY